MADLEKLVLTIEARTAQYEKALKKIEHNTGQFARSSDRHFKKVGRAMDGLERRMKRFASRTGTLLVGAIVAKGISELTQGIDEVLDDLDRIGKTADKIGQTTDALQELRYAGKLTGVETRAMDVALQRWSRRLAQAASGSGELAKTLEHYGVSVRDSEGRMRSNIDVLNDYADVINRAESDQERLRLAFVAFDTEGAAMVNTLRNGSEGLSAMREEARELGVVIGEDLVRDAEILNDEYTRVMSSLGAKWKTFVVNVARGAAAIADSFRSIDQQGDITLENRLRDISLARLNNENAILAVRNTDPSVFGKSRAQLDSLIEYHKKIDQQLADEERQIMDTLAARREAASVPPVEFLDAPGGNGEGATRRSTARDEAARASQREADQIKAVIAALAQEYDQLGMTADAQELYNHLNQAGVTLESEHGRVIEHAVNALQRKRREIDLIEQAHERLDERIDTLTDSLEHMAESGLDAFLDWATGAESFGDAVGSLAIQLGKAAAQAALFGSGPFGGGGGGALGPILSALAGGLGSLFGGGGGDPWAGLREFGGTVLPGQMYKVGEKGVEAFIPTHAGRIEPHHKTKDMMGGQSGGGVVVHMTVNATDARSFQKSQGQIAADLARAVSRGQRNL